MKKDSINISSVSLGSDPEVFLFSELENKHKVAIGLVGGTKDKPTPITDKGHFIQEDGCAAEFNIPPCKTADEMKNHLGFVLNYLRDTIAKPNNLVLSKEASAEFSPKELDCRQAQEIGCTPSINAWQLVLNSPQGYLNNQRSVGGHLHIGYENQDEQLNLEIVKVLDLFLGIPSVILDKDTKRRDLYGKAGDCRMKSFGVEYRVLSNFWIFDDVLIQWVFDNTIKALEYINMGGEVTNPDEIQKAINTCDKVLAQEIIEDYNIPMPILIEDGGLYASID